jgi:phage shock protein PspC (stress-responsive transcriptional regulator)
MIAGVVGGLAKYFGIDSTLARVVYVLLWAIVPWEEESPQP